MPSPAINADPAEDWYRNPLFPPTQWSAILALCHLSSPGSEEALAKLCQRYWYPLYAYLRRNGHSPEQAEDLTQDFFAQRVVTGEIFRGVDPAGGRFRTWLLNSLQNLVRNDIDKRNAQKRGGGQPNVPIDFKDAEGRYIAEPADNETPETLFERAWMMTTLERALENLRLRYESAGKLKFFEAMRVYLPGAFNPKPYAETAALLGKSEDAIKTAANRLRNEYGIALTDEIKRIVSDPEDVRAELMHLAAVIGR